MDSSNLRSMRLWFSITCNSLIYVPTHLVGYELFPSVTFISVCHVGVKFSKPASLIMFPRYFNYRFVILSNSNLLVLIFKTSLLMELSDSVCSTTHLKHRDLQINSSELIVINDGRFDIVAIHSFTCFSLYFLYLDI